jgi:hypothetical protein
MTTTARILILAALTLAAGSEAAAQTPQVPPAPPSMGFINVNVGGQIASRSAGVNENTPLYGEALTVATSQSVGSGALFDVSGGYRVWRNVSAAIGFSDFSKTSDASGSASIPNPLIFDQPAIINVSQSGLHHTERAVHIMASWLFPVTNEFDVTFAVGPSIFSASQEIVSVTVPPGTQSANASVGRESKSGVGAIVQVDGNYMLRQKWGVAWGAGAFLRYAGARVDLPSVPNMKVGGFQLGAGLRARF